MKVALAIDRERIALDMQKNGDDLPLATDAYITDVQKYVRKEWLDRNKAKHELADVANEVQDYCPDCSTKLDRVRETL